MIRTIRTLLLSAAALGALATAAIAAPTPPTSNSATGGMAGMHATGTTQMHTTSSGMDGMHAAMMADPAVHDSMLDDPTMQAHLAEFGIDAGQMRRWHDEGRSVDEMHETLADQGIDVDAPCIATVAPTRVATTGHRGGDR